MVETGRSSRRAPSGFGSVQPESRAADGRPLEEPEFPGCKPMHLPRSRIGEFEGRLEFWDARTETAWVCEPTSPYHERPSQSLAALVDRIAAVRGSSILCYGSMGLLLRDEHGEARRILQADQSVYLHPKRAKLPGLTAMVIGEHDFPDVVVEVDHTTDVRRGKLWLYEEWGFPEVWVEVPNRRAPSRRKSRRPGLTVHVLEDGAYRVFPESRAFPGWTAADLHIALNEKTISERTCSILERVGAALGEREGTGPDDDPLLRSQRRQGFERGRLHSRAAIVRQILQSRGIEVSEGFLENTPAFTERTDEAVVAAALACESEADFEARLRPCRR